LYTIESNGTIPESVLASIPLKMVRWSLSPLIYIQKWVGFWYMGDENPRTKWSTKL